MGSDRVTLCEVISWHCLLCVSDNQYSLLSSVADENVLTDITTAKTHSGAPNASSAASRTPWAVNSAEETVEESK